MNDILVSIVLSNLLNQNIQKLILLLPMTLSIINLWKRKIIKMWFSTKCQAVPDLTKAKTWPFHRYVYTFHPFALYISAFMPFHALPANSSWHIFMFRHPYLSVHCSRREFHHAFRDFKNFKGDKTCI